MIKIVICSTTSFRNRISDTQNTRVPVRRPYPVSTLKVSNLQGNDNLMASIHTQLQNNFHEGL